MEKFNRERIERAARIYSSNRDAGVALGIAPGSFGRLCRRYGVETPQARRRQVGGHEVGQAVGYGTVGAIED